MLASKELFFLILDHNRKLARRAGLKVLNSSSFQLFPLDESKVAICHSRCQNLLHFAVAE
jgi:hypothetical protein